MPSIADFVNGKKIPSALSFYMTDFKHKVAVVSTAVDLKFGPETHTYEERVQHKVFSAYEDKNMFFSFYVQNGPFVPIVIKSVAASYRKWMDEAAKGTLSVTVHIPSSHWSREGEWVAV